MPPQQPYGSPYQMPNNGVGLSASQQKKSHASMFVMIALVVFILLFLGSAGFGIWAYGERTDYKENSDKKVAVAVADNTKAVTDKKDALFAEERKNPLNKYAGPATFGSLDVSYPDTWSAYVAQDDRAAFPIDAYFHPNFVPGFTSGTAYALRIRISAQPYVQELRQFDGKAKTGKVKITGYAPKNVSGVNGSRIEGEINQGQKDYMVMMPLRDKTLKIWTESPSFLADFDKIILENLRFAP